MKFFRSKKHLEPARPENAFDIQLETSKHKLDAVSQIDTNMEHIGQPLIQLVNLTKEFNRNKKQKIAVNKLNLTLYDGENVAILGANGAGKTTTVEMITGITKPSHGEIKYFFQFHDSFHEKIGIQFQDSSYPPGISVKNVIQFMRDVYNIDLNQTELNQIVEAFGLKDFYTRRVKTLSGGQQQRLNILLALIHKPKIVFLDELSTGLDISVRTQIIGFVKRYCERYKINIVLVSHNMDEVQDICRRIIIMQLGKIKVDILTKDALIKYPTIEALAEEYI